MTLTQSACDYIVVASDILDDYILNPADYTSVTVSGSYNQGTTFSYVLTTLDTTGEVRTYSGEERIYPEFYELTDSFSNGVYSLTISAVKEDDTTEEESGCVFMDCTIKCNVVTIEQMVLHYALVNANGCTCNCAKMYTVYQALQSKITTGTANESDCGC